MKENERIAHIVNVVKAYCDADMFTHESNVRRMLGWKFSIKGNTPRIFTTVGWALVEFRLKDKYGSGIYVNALKAAGLPESLMDASTYDKVASYAAGVSTWERTENFAQAVAEADKYIVMPDNHCFSTKALKPLRPFLSDEVEYRQVRDVQMMFRLDDGDVFVSVAPLTKVKDDAVVVKAYNPDMKGCGGLFF